MTDVARASSPSPSSSERIVPRACGHAEALARIEAYANREVDA